MSTVWVFETTMSWLEYSHWVTARLQTSFWFRVGTGPPLEFARHPLDDSYSLRLEPDPDKPGRIRVEFVAVAN